MSEGRSQKSADGMKASMGSQWGLLSVIPVSLTTVPLAYFLNSSGLMENPLYVMITGALCLLAVVILPTALIVISGEKHDPIFYVLGLFLLSSVMDVFIGLESEGVLPNFLTFYLLEGEPYLGTPHGTAIVCWDAVAHFIMNSAMIIAECRQGSFLEVGLYWVGSLGHSMFVFMPGNAIGKSGVKWSILLNVPYMIVPYWAGYRLLRKANQQQPSDPKPQTSALWRRPLDWLFVLYLLAALTLACFRAMAVLGCTAELSQTYIRQYEPYLLDDNGYPKMQMLVYLFYFVPYYVAAICGLWDGPAQPWMVSWSIIHAGAAAQAQFAHIFAGTHSRTADQYRIPADSDHRLPFYLINGALFVVPQLLALRCLYARRDRHTPSKDVKKSPVEVSAGAHVKKRKHYKQQ